jgi:hypothetical protein
MNSIAYYRIAAALVFPSDDVLAARIGHRAWVARLRGARAIVQYATSAASVLRRVYTPRSRNWVGADTVKRGRGRDLLVVVVRSSPVRQRRVVPGRPFVGAAALRAVAAGELCDRLHRAADGFGSVGAPADGSLGLQDTAGFLVLVARRLGKRATVLVGPQRAVLEGLAQCAALRGSLDRPHAVGVRRGGREEVARSELVIHAVDGEAAGRHGPRRRCRRRRRRRWWRRRRGRRDLEHLRSERDVVRALRQTHGARAVGAGVLRAVDAEVREVALAVPAAALVCSVRDIVAHLARLDLGRAGGERGEAGEVAGCVGVAVGAVVRRGHARAVADGSDRDRGSRPGRRRRRRRRGWRRRRWCWRRRRWRWRWRLRRARAVRRPALRARLSRMASSVVEAHGCWVLLRVAVAFQPRPAMANRGADRAQCKRRRSDEGIHVGTHHQHAAV